jgi:hypothetical protein
MTVKDRRQSRDLDQDSSYSTTINILVDHIFSPGSRHSAEQSLKLAMVSLAITLYLRTYIFVTSRRNDENKSLG